MDAKVDLRELTKAFQVYEKATEKDMAYILNRAGRNIAFKSIKYTPKAIKTAIKSSLESMVTWRDGHQVPLKYLLANSFIMKRGYAAVTGNLMKEAAARLLRRRNSSVAYIKAGWLKAAIAFGGTREAKFSKNGLAKKGYGKPATPLNLKAVLANYSYGAELIGSSAVQKAVIETSADMISFANKKLEQSAKAVSGK